MPYRGRKRGARGKEIARQDVKGREGRTVLELRPVGMLLKAVPIRCAGDPGDDAGPLRTRAV